ncbi:MAG: ATP F0F1 synthase subunit B' [Rhodobacterales bacterium]|nr:MAG: ATP F0F1 synthase subunit B' [Rhodobacterales bacterium]
MANTTHVESVAAEMEHAAESGAGMPQLDFSTFPNQIFWLIVALLAIYFILTRVALPRIGGVLAERQGTITNDLASAEELKQKAVEAEAAYDQALADARAEANQIVEKARADIQKDLDAELARADAQIAEQTAEAEKAIADIRDQAASTAREAAIDTAGALVAALGGSADQAALTAAVDERIKG